MNEKVEEILTNIVGALGPLGFIVVFSLVIIQFRAKYSDTDPILLGLSKFGLICNSISIFCIILTFYSPFLGSKSCYCSFLWRTSIIAFVIGLFNMKFIYLFKIAVYFTRSSITCQINAKLPWTVILFAGILVVFLIICIGVQFVMADGTCVVPTKFGCNNTFDVENLYLGFAMLWFDIILFFWFTKLWLNKIKSIMQYSPESVKASDDKLLRSFKTQLFLTVCCFVFATADGVFHLLYPKYYTISFLIMDNVMSAFGNSLAFMKVRVIVYKMVTFECLRPSLQFVNDTSNTNKSQTKSDHKIVKSSDFTKQLPKQTSSNQTETQNETNV